jgi:penicillin-binding protein 2
MLYKHRQDSKKELDKQKKIFRSRLYITLFFSIALFMLLLGRMAYLQIINFQQYSDMSEVNRISINPITPTRGKIYDRNNIILADNKPIFVLSFVKKELENITTSLADIKQLLPNIPQRIITSFTRKLKSANQYKPLHLPYSLSEKEAAIFSVNSYKFAGINLNAKQKRHYPLKKLAAHALGYVGRINQKEVKRLNPQDYLGIDVIGKLGIEEQYENLLRGQAGVQQVETNARGKIIRKLETLPAISGQNIQITIDVKLQQFIENYLGDKKAAIIVTEPNSGEILAYVSSPGYDPNLFIDGISQKNYSKLLKNPTKPLINRILNGQYPPASTIKPFIALGALENRVIPFYKEIYDPGYFKFMNHKYRDWKKGGHGLVDMQSAIEQSCDTYFYQLGLTMGIQMIHDYLEPFGFGKKTNIDLSGESIGILPSKQWKRKKKNKTWFHGETIIVAIGQGYFSTTPLQLIKATSILANRGKVITPHLLKYSKKELEQIPIKSIRNWDRIITSMEKVMTGRRGTARQYSAKLKYNMAGKTGTSQVFSIGQEDSYDAETIKNSLRDHSLFIGFAPIKNPTIAITVIIENATIKAASTAIDIVNFYLDQQNKESK